MATSKRASQKKAESKRKKRVIKKTKARQENMDRNNYDLYPSFEFKDYNKREVSEKFVIAVKQALNNFDYNGTSCVNRDKKKLLRRIKKYGIENVINIPGPGLDGSDETQLFLDMQLLLGNWVYNYLSSKGILKNFLPVNDCKFILSQEWIISFRGLLYKSTPKGLAYYSPKCPLIGIDGCDYIISYSNHALERMSQRCIGDQMTYAANGDLFAYLYEKNKIEACEVFFNDKIIPAIALYKECMPGFASYQYAIQVAEDDSRMNVYYHKMGYIPLGIYENFARGITFLTPGMKGTPEDMLIQTKCSRKDASRLYVGVKNTISFENFMESMDLSTIKWFHENGVKQIIKEF